MTQTVFYHMVEKSVKRLSYTGSQGVLQPIPTDTRVVHNNGYVIAY